jgi:hypothetical protein
VNDSRLAGNQARRNGGAICISIIDERFTMTGSTVTTNTVPSGAGIYFASGNLQVEGTHILDNQGSHGPALYLNSMHDAVVADSCIVNNLATVGGGRAVELAGSNYYYLSAPNNWWGAVSGPSGAGLGSGDSDSDRVIFANFKTSPPDNCLLLPTHYLYVPAVKK